MKVSFNGLRTNLANAFNQAVDAANALPKDESHAVTAMARNGDTCDIGSHEYARLRTNLDEALGELQGFVAGLLACYDDAVEGDCDDLSDEITLKSVWDDE